MTRQAFDWLNTESESFLAKGYLLPGITAKERVREVGDYAEKLLGVAGFSDKFYDYMGRGWFSLSSPIWSNFGLARGLPISCFSSYVPDSMDGILSTLAEVGMMSKYGGGTSGVFSDVRHRGAPITNNGESEGAVNFIRGFDTVIDITKQGSTRRGSFAAYLSIDHDDFWEFIEIKSDGNPIQNVFFGVTVPPGWMRSMIDGDKDKRKRWAKVLEKRKDIGLPYIIFLDNANEGAPEIYRKHSMAIKGSNLCTEIFLPVSELESFVCDLMSMNALYFDEWKDTDAVEIAVMLLDAVMTEFIEKARDIPYFDRAVRFAERHRALGLGILGWHSYLQSKMVPIESFMAQALNERIFKTLRDQAYSASAKLAYLFGEPELLKGEGRRNTTLIAIAPTTSSAFILGQVSQSIEPLRSNYYVKDLAKAKHSYRNPYLQRLLTGLNKDNPEVWRSILEHDGSVQHLDFLTDDEKKVFKTFAEISQYDLVEQAAQRQKYIDQGQSLNLMIHPETPTKDINALYIMGWEQGLKSFYYQVGISAAQQFSRNLVTCSSCEG